MRISLVILSAVFVAPSVQAIDFFLSDTVEAETYALMHRAIPEAMASGQLIEGELNVEIGQGPMICTQGMKDRDAEHPSKSLSEYLVLGQPNVSVVLDSTNVCISK